jgi:hypothetical protein
MSLVRSIASAVSIVTLVLAAIFAGMYLLGVGQPDDTELIAPQDGFTSVSVPAQEGQLRVDERLVAPAAEAPSFA